MPPSYIILIFLFILPGTIGLIILSVILKSPEHRGKAGERKVADVLDDFIKNGKGYLINDVIIPDEYTGRTSQIDHILILESGVYVVETKNYSGRIYGSEKQREWTQVLQYGKEKHKLYNPLMQNRTHIKRLENLIGRDDCFISCVVFVQGNIEYINAPVLTRRSLRRYIASRVSNKTLLSAFDMADIFNAINDFKENPVKTSEEHVKEIKKMVKDINNNICPRCGSKLVLKTGKNGRFWACSNYPYCNFTKKY